MAWNELDASGNYFICFRVGKKRFKRSLATQDQRAADNLTARVEENLQLLARGRLSIPATADVVAFLLSDGRINGPLTIPEQTTLKQLFDGYFKSIPTGSLEDSTVGGMKIHRKHLEKHFRRSLPIRTLSLEQLQGYVAQRAGKVSGATIKKEVVTLGTAWNWGVRSKLVEGAFPGRGLKYPKSEEKPPFRMFAEVIELTKRMSNEGAAELWECVYLTVDDIEGLLKHVENARLPFIYPMFVFAAHTGARRAEIIRTKVSDVDLKNGWITLHERKKAHDTKTTRRVPISARLHQVLSDWLLEHPGADALFCHGSVVARSKKRSEATGHKGKGRAKTRAARLETVAPRLQRPGLGALTRDEMHDHFKRALAGSKWGKLRGWHVFRHSYISCLASNGCDQRIIDDAVGHLTAEQRRRYRHLFPSVTKEAIAAVFG